MAHIPAGWLIAGLIASIGSSVYSSVSAAGQKMPEIPQAPDPSKQREQADEQARRQLRQRRVAMGRSETIFTSPLGIGGEADVARKTLTGQ